MEHDSGFLHPEVWDEFQHVVEKPCLREGGFGRDLELGPELAIGELAEGLHSTVAYESF